MHQVAFLIYWWLMAFPDTHQTALMSQTCTVLCFQQTKLLGSALRSGNRICFIMEHRFSYGLSIVDTTLESPLILEGRKIADLPNFAMENLSLVMKWEQIVPEACFRKNNLSAAKVSRAHGLAYLLGMRGCIFFFFFFNSCWMPTDKKSCIVFILF